MLPCWRLSCTVIEPSQLWRQRGNRRWCTVLQGRQVLLQYLFLLGDNRWFLGKDVLQNGQKFMQTGLLKSKISMASHIVALRLQRGLYIAVSSQTPSERILARVTHIISPLCQIWMIYPPFPTHILPRADRHILGRGDESDRPQIWILLGYPYGDWECIRLTPERNR